MRKLNILRMITLCMLCLCALAACIDHEPECDTCDEVPDGQGILLSFDFDDDEQTRSTLQSSEVNYKEMKEVYLYIFEGNTANARCIHAEPVRWEGEISQKHWISIKLKQEHEQVYTFMAVGVDDRAEAVYGFRENIKTKPTLGQFMAQLQRTKENGETDEQYVAKCKDDMAHTQFFVGYQSRTVTADVEEVALTLRRKVAGILVYLRNIPVNVTYKEKACEVKKLEVRLYQSQHTQLPIWKEDTQESVGSGNLNGSEVLFSLDLSDSISGFKPDKEGRYFVKKGNDSILDDSYLAGAYLLPIAKTKGKATISVNLRGDHTDGAGKVEKNTVLKTYEVRYRENKDSAFHTDFAIKENTLYAIGKKESNSTTVNDKPADLSGNLLVLDVVPWRKLGSTHTFPTVTGPARIEADYNDKAYIMDAHHDSLVITIKPAVDKDPAIKKQWTLSVNYGDELTAPDEKHGNLVFEELPKDWIHFVSRDANGKFVEYTNTLTGYDEQEVTVIINDYAVERTLKNNWWYAKDELPKFKNDIRRAVIELKTENVLEPYPLQVQQYNTLTIKTSDGFQNPRGITRLDYNCTFNKQTGEMMERNDSCKIDWGYFKTGNTNVSGDNPMNYTDGEITSDKCYKRWVDKTSDAKKAYMGSAIQKLTKRFINLQTINKDGKDVVVDTNPANDEDHFEEKNWYMPAYYEMWGVARTIKDRMDFQTQDIEQLMNMKKEDVYWNSSGDDGLIWDAYITRIGHFEKSEHKDKNKFYYARPMIKFPPKTQTQTSKQ